MDSKRIFITGGASGLGRALAEQYARAGWSVCIGDIHSARSQETLGVLRGLGIKAHALHCDVTREEDVQSAADWLQEYWGGVDVVVNNAGVAGGGSFAAIPLSDWQWILDINLLGVVRGCRVFTPVFQNQGYGHFINIASAAGFVYLPLMSAYNASKAAVIALSETLRLELAEANIKVSVVCPTFIRTNLADSARVVDPEIASLTTRMVRGAGLGPETVAAAVFKAAARDKFLILPNTEARLAYWMKRLLPFAFYAGVMRLKFREIVRNFGSKIPTLKGRMQN